MSCAGLFSRVFSSLQCLTRHILETDQAFPLESRRRAEDILVELKAKYFIQVFSGVKHGFAVRGDPDVFDERMSRFCLLWMTSRCIISICI